MILLTGARGFLGGYVEKELNRLKLPVMGTSSGKNKYKKTTHYIYLDVTKRKTFNHLSSKIDAVIHCAAIIPQKNKKISLYRYRAVNGLGSRLLFEEAAKRGCRKFILASTHMVIGRPLYLPIDEDHPVAPVSDYGLSKAAAERYCLELSAELKIPCVILRFSQIYGQGEQEGYVLHALVQQAVQRKKIKLNNGGKDFRDLIYVKDAARAVLQALKKPVSGIYNICSGSTITIAELARSINDVFGGGKVPVVIKKGKKKSAEGLSFDISKAQRDLKFFPQYTLREGLRDYKKEYITRSQIV